MHYGKLARWLQLQTGAILSAWLAQRLILVRQPSVCCDLTSQRDTIAC